jgi:hypothetical protein
MKNYELVVNQRNNTNLIHSGNIYNKDYTKSSVNTWRCCDRRCKGRGEINDLDVFVVINDHNHGIEESKILRNKISTVIKQQSI